MASRHQMALLVAAEVLLLTASTVHGSGRNQTQRSSGGRIVGGTNAAIEEFPWQVSLEIAVPRIHHCGGTVLSERWVLTAAHCFDFGFEPVVRSSTSFTSKGGRTHSVKRKILHERYKMDEVRDYDIALLEMAKPFVWTKQLQPIGGLASENPPAGTAVLAAGWGHTSNLRDEPERLQKLRMVVQDWHKCRAAVEHKDPGVVTERLLCAFQPNKGVCFGDSGGPIIELRTGVLVAVVSRGVTRCADDYPSLHTSVANLRGWIREKTGV